MSSRKYDRLFWEELEHLVKGCDIVIDRPKGTAHPRFANFIFPVDYGYLKGTSSMDGGGIDIWVGSKEPKMVDAVLCTIDMLKKDSEIKILYGCDETEKELIYGVQNSKYMKALFIDREV